MRLKAVPSIVDCSHHAFQAFAHPVPTSLFTSSSRSRKFESDHQTVSLNVLSNPFVSNTLLRSQSFNKISRGHSIRRSCSLNMDNIYRAEASFHAAEKDEGHRRRRNKRLHCAISRKGPFSGKHETNQDSPFLDTRFDFLEPMMLGIKPEFPDWPDQEHVTWASIEQKAKSFDIPLSLRMIKKKLQSEEGPITTDLKGDTSYCSVKAAFASMVFIVVELQSHALQMREALCHEDLEIISSKVQKEMHSSFVWLFQQVFSRTPALMLQVMILLANFSVYSASHDITIDSAIDLLYTEDKQIQHFPQIGNLPESSQDSIFNPGDHFGSDEERNLWNSMVDDAAKMQEEIVDDEVLGHDTMKFFVSPVSVKIESDAYEDYLRTDLLYQMNLSQEPNNPLLLCNYAQFLHLVAHDYDRAEECFKRAVQVLPPDAESLIQFANFLWTVRRDYWGAEERFLQALAVEPDNSYYASRYANFLWSTGAEETCFPLNNSHNTSS